MAIRARYERGAVGSPASVPYIPASFGQDRYGLGELFKGLAKVGEMLSDRREQEDKVRANRRIAEFELSQTEKLVKLSQDEPAESRIDETFRTQFEEAEKELLNSSMSSVEKEELSKKLPSLFLRLQKDAMRAELVRNHKAFKREIDGQTDVFINTLSTTSADPERDAAGMREEVGLNIVRAGERGVVSKEEQASWLREKHESLNAAMILGLIRKDHTKTYERLKAGEWDKAISPEAKERLLTDAEKAIRKDIAAVDKERRELIGKMNKAITAAEGDLKSGFLPTTHEAESYASVVGGKEGEEALARIAILKQYGSAVTQFASQSYTTREAVLNQAIVARNSQNLSREQIELFDLMASTHREISTAAEKDGYKQGLESRIISGALQLTPETMEAREAQAQQIRSAFGPASSYLTPNETQHFTNLMKTGSLNDQLSVINQFQNTPLLRQSIVRALSKENTPESRQLTVAFDLGASEEARTLLYGMQLIKAGAPIADPSIWISAQNAIFGRTFAGMEDVAASYRDAGMAYYIGKRGPGAFEEAADIKEDDLKKAIEAVLPGQIVGEGAWFGGKGSPTILTPSRSVTPEQFTQKLKDISKETVWWRHTRWFNEQTGEYEPVTDLPQYLNGAAVDPSDVMDKGALKTLGQGTYVLISPSGYIRSGNRMLVLDLRGMN